MSKFRATMKTMLLSVMVLQLFSACSLLKVYKIDKPQGTPLTYQQAEQVKVGMSVTQVKYILGSPAIVDGLTPLEWEYVYDFTVGTYGSRANIPETHKQQRLTVTFNPKGIVEKVSGLESLPKQQYITPSKPF